MLVLLSLLLLSSVCTDITAANAVSDSAAREIGELPVDFTADASAGGFRYCCWCKWGLVLAMLLVLVPLSAFNSSSGVE